MLLRVQIPQSCLQRVSFIRFGVGFRNLPVLTHSAVILMAWAIGCRERSLGTGSHAGIWRSMPPIGLLPTRQLCSYYLEGSQTSTNQNHCVQALLCHQSAAFQCPHPRTTGPLSRDPGSGKRNWTLWAFPKQCIGEHLCLTRSWKWEKASYGLLCE